MPPLPITLRNSNCRSSQGIMIACPHLPHGTLDNGASGARARDIAVPMASTFRIAFDRDALPAR